MLAYFGLKIQDPDYSSGVARDDLLFVFGKSKAYYTPRDYR
jgi:hypothetical protein